MKARRTLMVVGALAVCLALGLVLSRSSTAQQPAAPAPAPVAAGRYQMFVKVGSENTAVYVCDTATGQCWFRDTNPQVKGWDDMGSPAVKVNK